MCLIHISYIVSVYYCTVAPLISMCPVSSWSALTLVDARLRIYFGGQRVGVRMKGKTLVGRGGVLGASTVYCIREMVGLVSTQMMASNR